MKCKNCGADNPKGSLICYKCKEPFEPENELAKDEVEEDFGVLASLSLALSIFSFVSLCNAPVALVCGIGAIVLACFEKKKSIVKKSGFVLGIISTVLTLILTGFMIAAATWFENSKDKIVEDVVTTVVETVKEQIQEDAQSGDKSGE